MDTLRPSCGEQRPKTRNCIYVKPSPVEASERAGPLRAAAEDGRTRWFANARPSNGHCHYGTVRSSCQQLVVA